jgi:hypothetical protein
MKIILRTDRIDRLGKPPVGSGFYSGALASSFSSQGEQKLLLL